MGSGSDKANFAAAHWPSISDERIVPTACLLQCAAKQSNASSKAASRKLTGKLEMPLASDPPRRDLKSSV